MIESHAIPAQTQRMLKPMVELSDSAVREYKALFRESASKPCLHHNDIQQILGSV